MNNTSDCIVATVSPAGREEMAFVSEVFRLAEKTDKVAGYQKVIIRL
jgi:hypothetical protein